MECKFRKMKKTLLIQVSGELDHHTAKTLRERADFTLDRVGGKHIIFDFEEVSFMDSSGIGVMIGRYKRVQSLGGRVAIACANEKIREIIRLSGLESLLPSFSSMEEAWQYTEGRGNG